MRKALVPALLIILTGIMVLAGTMIYYFYYRVEGNYFESNGVKIHYTVEGEGQPVVLVHGFAVDADLNWRKQGVNRALRKNYKVIALDNRGHGKSGKPHQKEAYGVHMAEDVIHLLDHLGIEKAHLVGYSLGGFISLKCAVMAPSRWESLTIMGSAWETENHGRAVKALRMVETAYKEGKPLGAAMDYFEGKSNPELLKYLVVKFSKTFNDDKALGAVISGLNGLLISEQELKNISIPVCGIVGDEDPFYETAGEMKYWVQDYEFIKIEGGDHLTTPRIRAAKDALLKFLAKHNN